MVVGLAAPQIGQALSAFTAFGRVFINPRISWHNSIVIKSKEGCLSLGDQVYDTERYSRVHLLWYDKARNLHKGYFNDSAAVIIQHEMDHLEGVMCNER